MPIPLKDAKELLRIEKFFVIHSAQPGELRHWEASKERNKTEPVAIFRCRLREASALPRGLWFHAIIWPRYPKTMTIQMGLELPNVKGHQNLYRLENDPSNTHHNRSSCGGGYANHFFGVGESHEHSFLHNVDGQDELVSNLGSSPCAIPITEELTDFSQALAFVCKRLNISNPGDVPLPNLQLPLV